MFIPLRTDRPSRRRPVMVELLIAANVVIFLACLVGNRLGMFDLESFIGAGHFDPQRFQAWQLLSALLLHDPTSIWHVAFNMLFLWVFGCPVEDRLGRLGFLIFYVVGGAAANLAHMVVSPAPVIGASGAVAAVTGAFLALAPRSHIVVLFLLTLSAFEVSSLWFIGLYFVVDVLRQAGELLGPGGGHVAYAAHIAGYLYGFVVAFVLLAVRILPREEYDVFYLFTQARRRAAFRAASRSGPAGLWDTATADTGRRLTARKSKAMAEDVQRLAELRAEVNRLSLAQDFAGAAAAYRRVLELAPDSVFSDARQLDLGNQFLVEQDYGTAAAAYELLLRHYPNSAKAAEVRLMLGLVYARHLRDPKRARELIERAKPGLHDQAQLALADQLMAELSETPVL